MDGRAFSPKRPPNHVPEGHSYDFAGQRPFSSRPHRPFWDATAVLTWNPDFVRT
jgi:hypothetical protein